MALPAGEREERRGRHRLDRGCIYSYSLHEWVCALRAGLGDESTEELHADALAGVSDVGGPCGVDDVESNQ